MVDSFELPDDLLDLPCTADEEGRKLEHLDASERDKQHEVSFEAAARIQSAVTAYASEHELNRYDVEKQPRQDVRNPPALQE
ncbi:hypothetical protein [Streptomyces sp. NPDC051684]|uniref:hypothetical protein n=1 Tax=Streptomyces sp. NPDC051684 TaxID=3365670 RepID=UPI0037B9594D